jgi:hypothetical protein
MNKTALAFSALLLAATSVQAAVFAEHEVKPVPPLIVSGMADLGAQMWQAPEFNEFFSAGPENAYTAFEAMSHVHANPGAYSVQVKGDGIVMTPAALGSKAVAKTAPAYIFHDAEHRDAAERIQEKLYRYLENISAVDSESVGQSLNAFFDQSAHHADIGAHAASFPHEQMERLLPPTTPDEGRIVHAERVSYPPSAFGPRAPSVAEFYDALEPSTEKLWVSIKISARFVLTAAAMYLPAHWVYPTSPILAVLAGFIGFAAAACFIFYRPTKRDMVRVALKHGWSELGHPASVHRSPANWIGILRWAPADHRWARLNEAFAAATAGPLKTADRLSFLSYLIGTKEMASEWAPYLRDNHVGPLLGFLAAGDLETAASVAMILKSMGPYWVGEHLATHPDDFEKLETLHVYDGALVENSLAEARLAKRRIDLARS